MLASILHSIKGILPEYVVTRHLDSRGSKSVLLTFDDGPDPQVTPRVLDLLRKHRARAVFFVCGRRIRKAPYLLREVEAQGHIIGNHTYVHSNGRQPGMFSYLQDILHCQRLIEENTGHRPSLFRPAGGVISPTTLLAPRLVGLRTVTWSLDVEDWRCRNTFEAKQTAKILGDKIRSRDIVLLHDDNPHVLEILDILLPAMEHRKYDLFSGAYSI